MDGAGGAPVHWKLPAPALRLPPVAEVMAGAMRRLVTFLFFPLAIIALGLPLVAIVRLAAILLGTQPRS